MKSTKAADYILVSIIADRCKIRVTLLAGRFKIGAAGSGSIMKNRRNYYRILQVQPDAPAEIIRAGYRTLMLELKNHPDLGGSTYEASLLNEAYETLNDPERRADYDKKIQASRFKRAAASSEPPPAPSDPTRCPFCKKQLTPAARTGKTCPICNVPLPFSQQSNLDRESRRTIARMKKNDCIVYSCTWPETRKEGTMIDLSPKGMRFICSEKLNPGTVLKITTPLFKTCGVVTNQRQENSDASYTVGVSFIAVIFKETRGAFISVSG
jgi:hypothetical protein